MYLDAQHNFMSIPWADEDDAEDVEADSRCGEEEEEEDASDHDEDGADDDGVEAEEEEGLVVVDREREREIDQPCYLYYGRMWTNLIPTH